ncbi:autophagy-related protein 17 [Triangularia verruculosa]|uniref:Autophagy-related protein 17 n=1 Tax=Triangularia verruculosa TaxID=2587418 RepID=A0AAN6XK52_9PEZI|nr:autophagy-related protein 17 [Triangularia verruculosa]
MASPGSASSTGALSRPTSTQGHKPPSASFDVDNVPVEVLVKHLLGAKQSLSSMALVLRANDLSTHARQMHEESVVLSAQTAFLRHGIDDQILILRQVRRKMVGVYNSGRKDFDRLIRALDGVNGRLEQTIQMLRDTVVERAFRPPGEEPKSLIDFVDEGQVELLRESLKASIAELKGAQTSFDGDLLRFDDDLRSLSKLLPPSSLSSSPSSSNAYSQMPHLLAQLSSLSHAMAQHLSSLTRHFDMCVTAVRSTEGGAALARRRAAEATEDNGDPVSISGVITEQESRMAELEPMDPRERAEIIQVVLEDSSQVEEVVSDIQKVLQQMEEAFGALKDQANVIRADYVSTVGAFSLLEDIGAKLPSYVGAEDEFVQRWEGEKESIFDKMHEMDRLKEFYEGYLTAYDRLREEADRRKAVEDKIANTWRKTKEIVDGLLKADQAKRELFRQEDGEFLPTDLWPGMNDPPKRWEVVPVEDEPSTPRPVKAQPSLVKNA